MRLVFAALVLSLLSAACSPVYVARAGIAEARILAARQPMTDVMTDSATDEADRGKLAYIWEARRFAADSLGLRVGDAYTSFTELERDTLALVLSAAPADALRPLTWWFPIVGRLPYRAYFDRSEAIREQRRLESDGYDTYLRPTAAFSTLGWFSDPLLSTVLRYETVAAVETVIHELAHTHLFIPGSVQFNESFATFVGNVGAIEFFCGREGSGPRSVKCLRARAAWSDTQRFSRFLDVVVAELEELYAESVPGARTDAQARQDLLARKEVILEGARSEFRDRILPEMEYLTFPFFSDGVLNNATLLARMRYYHRLPDFQAFLERNGGRLSATLTALEEGVQGLADPFSVLEAGPTASSVVPAPSPL